MSGEADDAQKEYLINVSIKDGSKITFVNGGTGVETLYIINGSSISLSKGFVYTLQIEDKELDLDDHYMVKEIPNFASKCLIRGVSNGTVIIYPIINGVIISDGDLLGKLI